MLKQFHPKKSNNAVINQWFKIATLKNHLINRLKYQAPADPYKKIYICPKDVKYRVNYKSGNGFPLTYSEYGGLGQIRGGDWDSSKYRTKVNNAWKVEGLQERFEDGLDWENTTYYNHLYDGISQPPTGFETVHEYIIQRCEFYDELYSDIKTNGYKSGHVGANPYGRIGIGQQLEVLVTIDRNGEILLWNGHHRFAITQILDLDLPVQVVCRHKYWQKVRDRVHNESLRKKEDLRNHPDLHDMYF